MYKILMGYALINELSDVFDLCEERLGDKSLGLYKEAKKRTDKKMRKMLNLTLQSAISVGEV